MGAISAQFSEARLLSSVDAGSGRPSVLVLHRVGTLTCLEIVIQPIPAGVARGPSRQTQHELSHLDVLFL